MITKKRITLVDDNIEFLSLLTDQLMSAGYEVASVPLHQHTFQRIKGSMSDVVICDLGLDNVTAGWALIDMMYLDPATRDIPLILCAMASKQLQEAAAAFAGKGIVWLEKPFRIETLLDILEKAGDDPHTIYNHTRLSEL